MLVESKYNIGDNAWIMMRNRPYQGTVSGVFIYVHDSTVEVTYSFNGSNFRICENELFCSKEELLKSL